MTREEMSMQGIRRYLSANPDIIEDTLNYNPSYIFFRVLEKGPLGNIGVPLTPGRSLAVDPRFIPLGAPVFVKTLWPGTDNPLNRLMVAQDTGGAIKGPVRGDFFWGMGGQAGRQAGRMKQPLELWVLLPKEEAE